MIKKETVLATLAIAIVAIIGLMGFSPNVAAYDETDTDILTVTFTFDDGTNSTFSNGGSYYLTENQTTVVGISVLAQFYRHNTTTSGVRFCEYEMEGPAAPIWSVFVPQIPSSWSETVDGETVLESGYYNITGRSYDVGIAGNYSWMFYQSIVENDTLVVYTEPQYIFEFTLTRNVTAGDDGSGATGDIFMGDWEWFEMGMGFIGVVGFIMTTVFTAKLMSHKDPIVMIGAFMICMITFGVFIYVFLLGGS